MASAAPTRRSLLDDALLLLPTLAQRIVDATRDELAGMPRHHALSEIWQRQAPILSDGLHQALIPLLQAATQGRDPLARANPGLDGLSLVDEAQALRDVAIAHLINVIEEHNRAELHQLTNFFAATQGTARARKTDNPLRAALFAQAFYEVLRSNLPLDAQGLYELCKQIGRAPARALQLLYGNLSEQLRSAHLSQLVASHAAAHAEDLQQLRRAADSSPMLGFASTGPATLDGLSRRIDEVNSRPQALPTEPAPLMGPATLAPGKDLLTRLYDQILADPRLLPPLKARLARVQVAVARLAHVDLSLLRRQDHPTWRLLNRIAAHGMGFERAEDPLLQAFLTYLDTQIEQLVAQPQPSAALFEQVLKAVADFIARQASQRSAPSSAALAQLEREQQRSQWEPVLREQIEAQLAEAGRELAISGVLRSFLRKVWVQVILKAMVVHGRDAPAAQAAIQLVDELLASLQAPADVAAQERLRASVPGLVARIEQGMDSVGLPADSRQRVLDALIQAHGRLLLSPPGSLVAAPAPERAAATPDPELMTRRLLAERDSQLPTDWFHTHVRRAELPTVPIPMDATSVDARKLVEAWMDQLQIGAWYHLFVQSEWINAQITWIGESRQLFLFVGEDSEQRHSLTRGAVEQLHVNGLITVLDELSLLQRAVDEVMHDLDAGGR